MVGPILVYALWLNVEKQYDSSNRIKCAAYSFSTSQKIECDGPCPCDGYSSEETEFPTSTPGMSTAGTATVSKLTTTDLPVTEEGVLPESPPPIYSDEDEDYDYSWCKPFCKKGMKKV